MRLIILVICPTILGNIHCPVFYLKQRSEPEFWFQLQAKLLSWDEEMGLVSVTGQHQRCFYKIC
jgi:hypothetical protein